MTPNNSFTQLVPGFDFLQGLVKNAGSAIPNMGQWVAPTLNPEELTKRIEELRTVQFWLEQNARMLAATIQALEVQRMTLSTLKTMNVPMGHLQESLKATTPPAADPPASAKTVNDQPDPSPPQAVDPVQWWGALTQQFTQLAASAVKDHLSKTPDAAASPAPARKKSAAKPGVGKSSAKPGARSSAATKRGNP